MTAPLLARDLGDGRRVYEHPRTRQRVPSVTTVMKCAIAKPELVAWAARMSAQYAVANWDALGALTPLERVQDIKQAHDRERDTAAVKGDVVHTLIEAWGKGEPLPEHGIPASRSMDQFVRWIMDVKPRFIESEVTMWSHTYGYAGTADWIAEIGGSIWLGDNKTGKRVYPEVGLQLAALAGADCIIRADGSEEDLPDIQYLAALHVRPRSYKMVTVNHWDDNFRAFLAAREIYSWVHDTAPGVLGGM